MSFGVLTLATMSDYEKAIGLALSLRVSNPEVPVAVACTSEVRPFVERHFDFVTEENPNLRGFVHKLYLDKYSPFDETFFFDSDVLVFRSLRELLPSWRTSTYAACGNYVTGGISPFGLDRSAVLQKIKRNRLVHIDGAGHAYFRKPDCTAVFDLARAVASDYQSYAGDIRFADEDVMDIVMSILNIDPKPHSDFWSRYCSGRRGTVRMSAETAHCSLVTQETGVIQYPYMMHFAANEAPFHYYLQLRRLYRKFGLSTGILFQRGFSDFLVRELRWPIVALVKRTMSRLGAK